MAAAQNNLTSKLSSFPILPTIWEKLTPELRAHSIFVKAATSATPIVNVLRVPRESVRNLFLTNLFTVLR